MKAVIDIIVPVFGTVAIGWFLGRSPLLTPEGLRGLTNVTFFALFPALLFRSMSRVRVDALEPGIIIAFFGTAQPRDAHYTRYIVVDDVNLQYRPYPASRGRQAILANRDIIRLFSALRVSDSFLLQNNLREILFRKPTYETR